MLAGDLRQQNLHGDYEGNCPQESTSGQSGTKRETLNCYMALL